MTLQNGTNVQKNDLYLSWAMTREDQESINTTLFLVDRLQKVGDCPRNELVCGGFISLIVIHLKIDFKSMKMIYGPSVWIFMLRCAC